MMHWRHAVVPVLGSFVVVACTHSKEPTADPSATTSSTGAPSAQLPQGHAQPAPSTRTLPKLDLACNADADCAVVSDELQDDAPRTYACCPGCTQHAVNAAWYKSFQSACAASPASMCPPIGCAMAVVKAACRAHRCEIAATKPGP